MQRAKGCWPLVLVLGVWTWLWWPSLTGQGVLAWRDSGYLYYPLYEWIAGEWQAGRVPLWNPYDDLGLPVVADATSAVFYPGSVILLIPGLSFATRYGWYLAGHVLLAGAGTYCLARRLGASSPGASLAACSYMLSGPVLGLTSNAPLLVGAAWAPWALAAMWHAIGGEAPASQASAASEVLVAVRRSRPVRAIILAAVTLAMIVLGGDAQMAGHVVLAGGLAAVVVGLKERTAATSSRCSAAGGLEQPGAVPSSGAAAGARESGQRAWPVGLAVRLGMVGGAAALAAALAAVQVLPTIQRTGASERSQFELPRSLFEIPEYLRRTDDDGWEGVARGVFGKPVSNTHHDDAYEFSLAPWTLAEAVWPNVTGRMFNIHRRWVEALPGADRVWHPTLYLGFAPLLLGVGALSVCRRAPASIVWLSLVSVGTAVAAFGWYGLGWLIDEVSILVCGAKAEWIGAPVGGLYWMATVFLPGYIQFRYPAKLMVLATLAMAALAGVALGRWTEPARARRLLRTCVGLAIISGLGWGTAFVGRAALVQLLSRLPGDPIWGPLDAEGAAADIRCGLAQALVLAIAVSGLVVVARRRASQRAWHAATLLVVVITIVDLVMANRWVLTHVPSAAMRRADGDRGALANSDSRLWRAIDLGVSPARWAVTASLDRMTEVVRWQRTTSFPKTFLAQPRGVVGSFSTLEPIDLAVFKEELAARFGSPRSRAAPVLTVYGISEVVYDVDQESASANGAPPPRSAWVAERVEVVDELGPRASRRDVVQRTAAVLDRLATVARPNELAILETNQVPPGLSLRLGNDPRVDREPTTPAPQCDQVRQPNGRVTVDVTLDRPALLVVNDYFAPGWHAVSRRHGGGAGSTGESIELPIIRTNRVLRGIWIAEPGQWQVELQYRPRELIVGGWISGAAWLGIVAVLVVWAWCKGHRAP